MKISHDVYMFVIKPLPTSTILRQTVSTTSSMSPASAAMALARAGINLMFSLTSTLRWNSALIREIIALMLV